MARRLTGYFRMHRQILTHWVYEDHIAFRLFTTLLALAEWKDSTTFLNKQLVCLKRGQLCTSWNELAKLVGCDRRTIHARLHALASCHMIASDSTPAGTIITILNYNKFQCDNQNDVPDDVPDNVLRSVPRSVPILKKEEIKKEKTNNPLSLERGKKSGAKNLTTAIGARAVGILRKQIFEKLDPTDSDIGVLAFSELRSLVGSPGVDLLKSRYPTWAQFAIAWIDQHKRGYSEPFERKLKADLRALQSAVENQNHSGNSTGQIESVVDLKVPDG